MKSKNKKSKSGSRIRIDSRVLEMRTYISEGNDHMKNGVIGKALSLYSRALELSPKDTNAMIARSKCHLRLGEAEKALQDAESALEGNLKDIDKSRAIFCKAEALYHLGDFEMSLVYYHRGMKIRPEFDHFRQGVQKAKEAIKNILQKQVIPIIPVQSEDELQTERRPVCASLGPSTTSNLTDSDVLSATPNEASTITEPIAHDNVQTNTNSNIGLKSTNADDFKTESKIPSFAKHRKKESNGSNLLGRLNVDKKYLQNLLKRSDIKVPYQESTKHIMIHAQEGLHFLQNRREFWRQQRANVNR